MPGFRVVSRITFQGAATQRALRLAFDLHELAWSGQSQRERAYGQRSSPAPTNRRTEQRPLPR